MTCRNDSLAALLVSFTYSTFLYPLDVPAGSNLICTCIHRALTRLIRERRRGSRAVYIDELAVQVDNCVGENKCHILVGYLGSLVGRGIVGRVVMNFMMVGHTHNRIEQVFSRWATLALLCSIVQEVHLEFAQAHHERTLVTLDSLREGHDRKHGMHVEDRRGCSAPHRFNQRAIPSSAMPLDVTGSVVHGNRCRSYQHRVVGSSDQVCIC